MHGLANVKKKKMTKLIVATQKGTQRAYLLRFSLTGNLLNITLFFYVTQWGCGIKLLTFL